MERKSKVTDLYLTALGPAGIAVFAWAVYGIEISRLDLPLAGLAIVTLFFGSFLRVQLPRTKIHLTLSDTLVFVIFVSYGAHIAVLIGMLEALTSSLNFRRKGMAMSGKTIAINVNVTALSIVSMFAGVFLIFGAPETVFASASIKELAIVLTVMALAQFSVNSVLVSIFISIRSGETLWHVWNEYCLNALVMYLTGAVMAGIVVIAFRQIDPFLLGGVGIFFSLVYITYVRYVNDIKRTAEKAEEAERKRAEQAEKHIDELKHYVGELERTADALSESREQFRHAAFHDRLTDLPNRNWILQRLAELIAKKTEFSVLFLDLDRFRSINDSLGHSIGDKLLVEVRDRILRVCGVNSVVRFSGDEFAVLVEGDHAPNVARSLAAAIVATMQQPFEIEGRTAFIGVSIGLAKGPADYQRPEEPLRDSDIAMYHAKDQGISLVEFDSEMHSRAVKLHRTETELRVAIDHRQFAVFYQPIVDLTRNRVYGFEALVRWKHPERGFVAPYEFIPVAESTGLIIPLTEQILQDSFRSAAQWNSISPRPLTISVNISGKHFESPSLIKQLEATLQETSIDPRLVKLEITESAIMNNADAAISTLHRIRAMGMNISIDDFGTGYSSLSYLQRFPIDTLKIDRSFVSTSEAGKENGAIVRTIVSLAKALDLSIVAEGIETDEQFRILRSLGCDHGQGYLFAKPMPEDEIYELVTGVRRIEALNRDKDIVHFIHEANIDNIDLIQ